MLTNNTPCKIEENNFIQNSLNLLSTKRKDMNSELKEYLCAKRCKTAFYTHVSTSEPRGKFIIGRENSDEFWDLYCNDVFNRTSTGGYSCIAERPQEYLPVLVDIDLKVVVNNDVVNSNNGGDGEFDGGEFNDDVLYTENDLDTVIGIYQSVLKSIIEDCTDKKLTCVVLEKKSYTKFQNGQEYVKHGFHLHFPFTFMRNNDQEIHLLPRVKEAIKRTGIFDRFKDSPVDSGYLKAHWLMYGSAKEIGMEPYSVSKVINANGDIVSLEDEFSKILLYDHNDKRLVFDKPISYYLPRILSTNPKNRPISYLKKRLPSPIKNKIVSIERSNQSRLLEKQSIKVELGIAKELLTLISSERADNRDDWMTIGWTLYNIGEGCEEALDLWLKFSSQCVEKYDEAVCVHQWSSMNPGDYTLGTLRYFASIDNEKAYIEMKKRNSVRFLHNISVKNHYDIAKALFETYGDTFKCCSFRHKEWYEFKNHVWNRVEQGYTLRDKISTEIFAVFREKHRHFINLMAEAEDEHTAKRYSEEAKQCHKMMESAKTSQFKTSVMKECMDVFFDPKFKKKLDANRYIFGIQNGVLDCTRKPYHVRPGRPDDYISKKGNVMYSDFTWADPRVEFVSNYLSKVFPDRTLRQYFLDKMCRVFIGGNQEKKVFFWSGVGDNSKTVIQNIFEQMLGEYAIKLSTVALTGKKGNLGSVCPELARAGNGVRWVVFQEPDREEQIKTGRFKEFSGNDTFFSRTLYSEGCEITPMFKMIFICNDLPTMGYPDKAAANRTRVIPFESTFCEDAPENTAEQMRQKRFPMDSNFSDKIPGMIDPLFWFLLQHLNNYTPHPDPPKVTIATSNYMKRNDIYRQFIEECVVEEEDSCVALKTIYTTFKTWHRESFSSNQLSVPSRADVRKYLEKLWGTPERGVKWFGYKIQEECDDDDTETVVFNNKL